MLYNDTEGHTAGLVVMESLTEMLKGVVEGSVYTILLRLEKNKLVNIEKRPSFIGPPHKFYTFSKARQREPRESSLSPHVTAILRQTVQSNRLADK